MKNFKFAWADVAIGAVVSAIIFAVFYMNLADGLEAKLYDVRAKMRAKGKAGDKVVLVTIDDKSVEELGRWPWPRNYMAEMVDQLTEAGAETIGVAVGMTQPELNPGLNKIQDLAKSFEAEAVANAAKPSTRVVAAKTQEFADILKKSAAELDNDEKLAGSIAFSGKVVLPMYFTPGQGIGKSNKPIPEEVEKNFIANL